MKKYIILLVVLALASCRTDRQSPQEMVSQFDRLVNTAYEHPDDGTLAMVDSLVAINEVSEPIADYVRGIVNDVQRHALSAERYYTKSYNAIDPERDGWPIFMIIAGHLSQMRLTMNDLTGSLEVATKTLAQAEEAGQLNNQNKITFLWSIAVCQYNLNLSEFEETSQQVMDLLEQESIENGPVAGRNEITFLTGQVQMKTAIGKLAEADSLLNKTEALLDKYNVPGNEGLVAEYRLRLAQCRILILDEQGKTSQAMSLFEDLLPKMSSWPDGLYWAAAFLMSKERYAEAADLFERFDSLLPDDSRDAALNLDNIDYYIIPRLKANLGAGRKAAVMSIAGQIADAYPQALENDRNDNAAELATIYDTQGKEMQIARQQAKISRQRLLGAVAGFGLITLFFIVYTVNRRRAARRLAEVQAAKERIESELRIARDIQMSMVPGVFPQRDGLDMYAEMAPAKEVGGDLYGYILQGDCLYFCVGDVSGKGVPASLFMAQSARLFRTLASEGMMPADIALRMNNELAENNDKGMFVTMFIGLLHLDTGRLDYCNCGHNAPVLDGAFLKMEYTNQPLGLWEGDPFCGESIDDIRGRRLLIYTDGLNEAENPRLEMFGNDRLLQVMADTDNLSSKEVIERLKEAVHSYRDGAEPNDDLTLMCLLSGNALSRPSDRSRR